MKTQIQTQGLENVQGMIQDLAAEYPNAAVRALNKSMTGGKTDMKATIREVYRIPAGIIDKRIGIVKATRANLSGHIISKGRAIHLTDIPGTKALAKGKGISVNVRKDTGTQRIPRGFIATGRTSGKQIVFHRKRGPGPSGLVPRYPIEARTAPHPEVLYNAPANWAKIQTKIAERVEKACEAELAAELRRLDGKW